MVVVASNYMLRRCLKVHLGCQSYTISKFISACIFPLLIRNASTVTLYAALSSFSISACIFVLLLRRDSTLILYASLLSSWTHHIIFVSVLHSMLVTCSCVSFFTLPVHFLKPIVDTLSAVEHMDSDHTLQQTALRFLCKRVESNS